MSQLVKHGTEYTDSLHWNRLSRDRLSVSHITSLIFEFISFDLEFLDLGMARFVYKTNLLFIEFTICSAVCVFFCGSWPPAAGWIQSLYWPKLNKLHIYYYGWQEARQCIQLRTASQEDPEAGRQYCGERERTVGAAWALCASAGKGGSSTSANQQPSGDVRCSRRECNEWRYVGRRRCGADHVGLPGNII